MGLRPEPFFLGLAYAGLGLSLSVLFVQGNPPPRPPRSRQPHPDPRTTPTTSSPTARSSPSPASGRSPSRPHPRPDSSTTSTTASPGACSRSSSPPSGLSVGRIGILAAIYPAVWGLGQLYTGALSDRIGRKPLIVGGMLTQAVAIAWMAAISGFWPWAIGAAVLGAGTAMVYPTLLATIGDVAHPTWRARSVGIYRLWRDAGFAVGALLAGLLADLISIEAAIYAVAALTATSGLVVITRMYETHPPAPDR